MGLGVFSIYASFVRVVDILREQVGRDVGVRGDSSLGVGAERQGGLNWLGGGVGAGEVCDETVQDTGCEVVLVAGSSVLDPIQLGEDQ